MALTAAQTTRFLAAIESDSLVLLCGAGLSAPLPSGLPSAVRIARICYDRWKDVETLDPALRDDLDSLAGHFHDAGSLAKFIRLAPWEELLGQPNRGHAAIADLLVSRGAHAALSANFDTMIEQWAWELKAEMTGAITGQEAASLTKTSPLVKFHGCRLRQSETLWSHRQLNDALVKSRLESCAQWMNLHLPGKDILVIGFWTDWNYLNEVFTDAFSVENASSVTVVDPLPPEALEEKAPELWAKLGGLSASFEHIQASGDLILEDLRTAYSLMWAKRFYAFGQSMIVEGGGAVVVPPTPQALGADALYDLRRDAEGLPYSRAATSSTPDQGTGQAALVHCLLLNAGATQQGAWVQLGGRSIRVVNGAGRSLVDV